MGEKEKRINNNVEALKVLLLEEGDSGYLADIHCGEWNAAKQQRCLELIKALCNDLNDIAPAHGEAVRLIEALASTMAEALSFDGHSNMTTEQICMALDDLSDAVAVK